MAWSLKHGGIQLGDELLFFRGGAVRNAAPNIQSLLWAERAIMSSSGAGKAYRVRMRIYLSRADIFVCQQAIDNLTDLIDGVPRDVTVYDDSTLKYTWSAAQLTAISPQDPESGASAHWAEATVEFVTDQRPVAE